MSKIKVDEISPQSSNTSSITLAANNDVTFTGGVTANTFAGSGSSLTSLPAANLTGTLPALSAANLTSIPAANITGTLPALDGSALTGISAGALEYVTENAVNSGTVSSIEFTSTHLQANAIYRIQAICYADTSPYGYYFLPSWFDGTTQHGPGTSSTLHGSGTLYHNGYSNSVGNLDWWMSMGSNGPSGGGQMFAFEAELSTYLMPWLRVRFTSMDTMYGYGLFSGRVLANESTSYLNGLKMQFAGSSYGANTRIQLFKYVT